MCAVAAAWPAARAASRAAPVADLAARWAAYAASRACVIEISPRDHARAPSMARPRPVVIRISRAEVAKNVLRAVSGPGGKQPVLCILECPAATDRHETRISAAAISHYLTHRSGSSVLVNSSNCTTPVCKWMVYRIGCKTLSDTFGCVFSTSPSLNSMDDAKEMSNNFL